MGREITKLHPRMQEKIDLLRYRCTESGSIVTYAPGSSYSSMHQWGIAFDIFRNDDRCAYENRDGWFQKAGKIGQSIGLEWGGTWSGFTDLPHFQLPD